MAQKKSFNLSRYNKFIVALGGFVVSLLSIYFRDAQWLPPAIALLTSLGVYQIPNEEE